MILTCPRPTRSDPRLVREDPVVPALSPPAACQAPVETHQAGAVSTDVEELKVLLIS